VHGDDYANFYLQLTSNKQTLIKGITPVETDPSLWSQAQDIPFNIYPAQVTACGIGGTSIPLRRLWKTQKRPHLF
jgi:hypothetical protein